jgi:hexosaminidase
MRDLGKYFFCHLKHNYFSKLKLNISIMKNVLLACILLVLMQNVVAQHIIIPEPVDIKSNGEIFVLKDQLSFDVLTKDEQTIVYANQLKTFLEGFGIEASENKTKKGNRLTININKKKNVELGIEGYELVINSNSIKLTANKAAGVYNGIQTLKQLLPANPSLIQGEQSEPIRIIGCIIKDYPRFAWRGLMLDVSRHFFTVDEVKAYLDKMSLYKFNVFHWHLSDDQGWRIEIKSYPKLTEIGAWRVERYGLFGKDIKEPQEGEKATCGGYYTQEDIKEVIRYAAARNITIVPEIDVPGHSMAALAAYPELSSYKEAKFVDPGTKFAEWFADGSFKMKIENTLNPADEKVYEFLNNVFTEIADLFPGEYIHMGGDECYHGYWEENPSVQKFMKANKIANGEELQNYFVKRVEKIILSKGKKVIGWDEILHGDISKNTTIMGWQKMEGGTKAAKMGHNVVMTPTTYTYLDYSQGDHSVENAIYAKLSLKKAYDFEPVPDSVDSKYILGGQGNLWTEVIPNLQFAYYMTYPRAFALSETFWSPKENKNWNNFIQKTEIHFQRFDSNNTNICKAVYDPQIIIYNEGNKLMCKLTNPIPETKIYYTIDNTYPMNYGIKFTEPFEIPEGDFNLRTQTFRNNSVIGRELIIHRKELEKRIEK